MDSRLYRNAGLPVPDDSNDDDLRAAVVILALLQTFQIGAVAAVSQRTWEHTPDSEGDSRSPVANITQARAYGRWLLQAPDRMFKDLFRMKKTVFFELCRYLRNNNPELEDGRQGLELKVMIFLWICAYNETQRNTAYRFYTSQGQVSAVFHQLISPMRRLHTKFVHLPKPGHLSPRVELDRKMQQFNGTLGAVDGTHIPAFIAEGKQTRFRSYKNNISQNVFAVVSFEGLFLYILAGAEGSLHDSSLFREAMTRSFRIPHGRLYLADSGFGVQRGILVPFAIYTYHLQDWRLTGEKPANKEELYNFRHAQLRVIVEQVFGRCKRKFKIIRCSAPEYKLQHQITLIYALTALYNFIQLEGKEPEAAYEQMEETLTPEEREDLEKARRRANSVVGSLSSLRYRELIARWLWQDCEEARAAREESDDEDVFAPLEEMELDNEYI
ncbi:hypothetical protein S7711_11543 [Stachybotrys chartarum IBT 7711]|uniref:Uncharacterized protein n=1 Tax=Stachybotrys chartarum (strain CBS 109288 / IBT 7711) TaxID=1280523 RepID=A0A084B515_STACB|nr:hypothetical protein S7711_11543 [Stachybotrys chartarum IBT 7711]